MDIKVFRHFNVITNEEKYELPSELPRRGKDNFVTVGKEVAININSYTIQSYPQRTVYQYDIQIGSGVEKRALIQKVWMSKAVQEFVEGTKFIFDGNKLAWSMLAKKTRSLTVDLDAEDGVPAREGRENKHRVVIREVGKVAIGAIQAYLDGQMSFDSSVLQGINFLDHLLRRGPSETLTTVKQSFFQRGRQRMLLGRGIEAFKGIYQTIRACQGGRLAVNADVSNGVFWTSSKLHVSMLHLSGVNDWPQLVQAYNDERSESDSGTFSNLRRMRRLNITCRYRGCNQPDKVWIIDRFIKLNAKQYKFRVRDKVTKVETETTLFDYFRRKYNILLEFWQLPLVQTTKKGVILPPELCELLENQRYPFKLDDAQTANMIKFAVTRPANRVLDIEDGLGKLAWDKDRYLQEYGMKIENRMISTKARLLAPPVVEFKGSKATPGLTGRWDMRGKRFYKENPVPLSAWGVFVYAPHGHRDVLPNATVEEFVRRFVAVYQGHGGVVIEKMPSFVRSHEIADGLQDLYKKVESKHAASKGARKCQIILVFLADRNAWCYKRIKKNLDCRWGVVSQCVQSRSAQKLAPQYMSNVAMKFNAKLGGATARIPGKSQPNGSFTKPSMIIGADVSHSSPGSLQPSMAAVAVMADRLGMRYTAACETNGHRVEMITTANLKDMVVPQATHFIKVCNNGIKPQVVYYFRDGVSEGQYQHVLNQEVADMKRLFDRDMGGWKPQFVVVVASKRHHIRFFPPPGPGADRNGNPHPGTLVDRDVTHPFERDAYLCSHSAIQGTARPVHYHILLDEAGVVENSLYTMIYEHCYQYIRSTTPVSLHPAIYYAHLASNRAGSHLDEASSSGPQSGPGFKPPRDSSSATQKDVEFKPLIKMNNEHGIRTSMWYI